MAAGFLAIFSDVRRSDETDYLHWLTREHVQERLGVPGFLAVRIFRTDVANAARFLIVYRLRGPDVVGSAEYLARLNAPSAWSKDIMPRLENFVRGGGSIVREIGQGEGMAIAPLLFDAADITRQAEAAARAVSLDRMVAARIFECDRASTTLATAEKAMRGGDASFSAMLLLEALDNDALERATARVSATQSLLFFRQVFALRN